MKKALVLILALLLVAFAGMAKTNYFDNIVIEGSFALSGTSTTAFTCTTFLVTASTSSIFYTPSFGVGYDVGAAMTIAVANSTGNVTITHAGSNKSVTWTAGGGFDFIGAIVLDGVTISGAVSLDDTTNATNTTSGSIHTDGGMGIAMKLFIGTDLDVDGTTNLDVVDIDDAVDITGNLTQDGTTVTLDGSTSVRGISAGFTSLEANDIRFGFDASSYMKIVPVQTTGSVAVTHVGAGATAVSWTAGSFDFIGTMALDGTTISTTLGIGTDITTNGLTGVHDWFLTDSVVDALSIQRGTTDFIVFDTSTVSVDITGDLDVNGTIGLIDGSTSVDLISAGHIDLESADIRLGFDASDYMKLVTTTGTGALAITHVGGTGPDVTWTADSWTLTGGFEIIGTTTLDDFSASGLADLNGGIAVDTTVFTVDGATGAVSVAHTTPPDIVLKNTTTGVDADSGKFYWRGYDHDTTAEIDMSIFCDVTGAADYKLSFMNDGAAAEVASIDQGGNLQIDGILTVDSGTQSPLGVGAVSVGGASAVEWGDGIYHRSIITVDATGVNDIDLEDKDDGNGVLIYTFPIGHIRVLGVVADLSATSSAGIFQGTFPMAVGTAIGADGDATLTSTEADLCASTAISYNGVQACDLPPVSAADMTWDGTSSAVTVYLNAAVLGTDINTASTVEATGTVTIHWVNLGDY